MSRSAAKKCYEAAGLKPSDVDVIELHDCFSANELITYEALGLCPEGKTVAQDTISVIPSWRIRARSNKFSHQFPSPLTIKFYFWENRQIRLELEVSFLLICRN